MKISTIILLLLNMLFVLSTNAVAEGIGLPVKYISSCEIDLNADDISDVVLLMQTVRGVELIALIMKDNEYKGYILESDAENMKLECVYSGEIIETAAGEGDNKEKTHKTNGAYIELIQPECCSHAYYWAEESFKKVCTSD